MAINSESQFFHWYEAITKIRLFEESIAQLYPKEIIRCPVHLAIGHEASAVGVCSALTNDDLVLSYHRSHHHYLAKGGSPARLLFELLGDSRGCSGGRGGSTHLYAPEVGFMGSTAIISGILPIATGLAHSLKLKLSKNIVVCFNGDACIEEGVFFESLNMAALWNLPLLLVIEDNDQSCYTPKNFRQSIKDFSKIAEMYGAFYDEQDGSKTQNVYNASVDIIKKIKLHSKPGILKVNVFRAHEHCGPDQDNHLSYRDVTGHWPDRDPLLDLSKTLDQSTVENIIKRVEFENRDLFNSILSEKGINVNL